MPETVLERVAVGAGVLDRLRGHAADCSPEEACALLLGTTDGPSCVITDAILTENADHSPVRFAVPDDQLIRSYRTAEERRLEVAGIFHSHPGSPAVPSETDTTYMRLNPVAWVIYSGSEGIFRAWAMGDGVVEVPLVTRGRSDP